jgi:predicted nucleic acid-binding protein
MLLLISDANILIDLEVAGLLDLLFQLPMQFAMPDVLYWEEIEPGTPGLSGKGLRVLEVSGEFVQWTVAAQSQYGTSASVNDYLALALAKQESCPLLTGDQALKLIAQAENVPVMGTLWLLQTMIANHLLSHDAALAALSTMRAAKRRLPWAQAERLFRDSR